MTPLMIYNANQAELRRFALSLCRDPNVASDLVQETFLRVCQHADELEGYPAARVQGWLMLTLRRIWVDQLRKRSREQDSEAPPEVAHHQDFSGLEVFAALDRLPQPLREAVKLRHFAGFNATEIGKIQGIPAATVRTRLRTAATLLRADYLLDDEKRHDQ